MMSGKTHQYRVTTTWTGNLGAGTASYAAYSRNHEISGEVKQTTIACSSDPAFRGDATRYNPEELLVAGLSACHMLWVLHLCAEAGITVTDYVDAAEGTMVLNADGSGHFTQVMLRPHMTITDPQQVIQAEELHARANAMCFLARSMNFPVVHEAVVAVAPSFHHR